MRPGQPYPATFQVGQLFRRRRIRCQLLENDDFLARSDHSYDESPREKSLGCFGLPAEGEGVEPSRLIARPISNRVPSPFGLPFRVKKVRPRIELGPPLYKRGMQPAHPRTPWFFSVVKSSRRESNPRFLFVREASLAVGPRDVMLQMDRRGVEPRFPGCKAGVVPLDQQPIFPVARVGVEPTDISLSN